MPVSIDELFTNGQPYIALENGRFNFSWPPAAVRDVIAMWRAGVPVWQMAEKHDRDPDEVAVLILDLRRQRVIGDRPGWAWGDEWGKREEEINP